MGGFAVLSAVINLNTKQFCQNPTSDWKHTGFGYSEAEGKALPCFTGDCVASQRVSELRGMTNSCQGKQLTRRLRQPCFHGFCAL